MTPQLNEQKNAQINQLVVKEIEKAMSQIEFPKPPPNDIYFLPNGNNAEFLMCLGLEEVVKCVQESINNKDRNNIITNKDEIIYEFPYSCSNCSTDYTPSWRKDKSGNILCEKCLKTLEKKIIKAEHSARLKTAFLKAVKDKEIIKQRLINETLNSSNSSINNNINQLNNNPIHTQQPKQQQQQQQQQQHHHNNNNLNSQPKYNNNNNSNSNNHHHLSNHHNNNSNNNNSKHQLQMQSHHQKPQQQQQILNKQHHTSNHSQSNNNNNNNKNQQLLNHNNNNNKNNNRSSNNHSHSSSSSSSINKNNSNNSQRNRQSSVPNNNNNNNNSNNILNNASNLLGLNNPFAAHLNSLANAAFAQQQQQQQQATTAFIQRLMVQGNYSNINAAALANLANNRQIFDMLPQKPWKNQQ